MNTDTLPCWRSSAGTETFTAPSGCVGFHVALETLALRALEEGLDFRRFPGASAPLPGQTSGNFVWETLAQAQAWAARLRGKQGGRYLILAVDLGGATLKRDPALSGGAWFSEQPFCPDRLRLLG